MKKYPSLQLKVENIKENYFRIWNMLQKSYKFEGYIPNNRTIHKKDVYH